MNLRPATLRLFVAAKCVVPAILFVPILLAPSGHAEDRPNTSVVASAAAVADGRPWNMVMVEGQQKFKLTLMPNGTGGHGARHPRTRADLVAKRRPSLCQTISAQGGTLRHIARSRWRLRRRRERRSLLQTSPLIGESKAHRQ
jgi:hypothetical protein